VTLLERVAALLSARGIRHALIGAAALAVHGVSRSTLDQDLLVHDRRVLDPDFWAELSGAASIDIRTGDADDPLAGVVRASDEGERAVDVVVGRYQWQQHVLERATTIGEYQLPVVQRADLILLKLYAGGSQDKWDIEQLLAIDSSAEALASIDAHIASLPARSRELWRALRPAR
jgi:Nucleotidyl transferase of unknown function (DUF2204)